MLEIKDLSSIALEYSDVLETQVSSLNIKADMIIPSDGPALLGCLLYTSPSPRD